MVISGFYLSCFVLELYVSKNGRIMTPKFSFDTRKKIHFIGIGGIGMSGIAEVMFNQGHIISGSDVADNANMRRLKTAGIKAFVGHHKDHVNDVDIVVISSAIQATNPELIAAQERRIPVLKRAEILADLMRHKHSVAISGTHGKTTTTSLVACLCDVAGIDPTFVNGGVVTAYNSNARLGGGDWMIVEADESDGSFTYFHPTIAVVTNIDPEHMEFYGTFEALQNSFERFVHNVPFYGSAILCVDHPVVNELASRLTNRRVITYGLNPGAQVRAVNICPEPSHVSFDIEITSHEDRFTSLNHVVALPKRIRQLSLPMLGAHNVQNALAMVCVALELGFSEDVIRQTLATFKGVKRRFTNVGLINGARLIDDYAHHPVEIATVIQAARQTCAHGRIIAVVQPHRYTRLQTLFNEFVNCVGLCHTVLVAPVYEAGETPIAGYNGHTLASAIQLAHPTIHVAEVISAHDTFDKLLEIVRPSDIVLMLGAGSITYWAYDIAEWALTVGKQDKQACVNGH